MNFFDKLNGAIARNNSLLVLGLDPNPEMMPQSYRDFGEIGHLVEDLGDWLQGIVLQTADLVCAYKPTLGFYQSLGAEGLELLTQVLTFIPPHIPVILDAKHSDLNTNSFFARTAFKTWKVDAVTLNPYAGQDLVAPFLVDPNAAVFILCCTSNPTARSIQHYPNADLPLYLHVVKEAKTWGTPEQLALEVGSTQPEMFEEIRAIAPERTILARSIWTEGTNFKNILQAGLNDEGSGLLVPIPQDLLGSEQLPTQIQTLNQTVNQIRNERQQTSLSCDLWMPDVCLLTQHPHQDLILQLYDIGCILFGDYVQASGTAFSYYIDLRKIISKPQIFHRVLTAYAQILQDLTFDRIAGIPYGSLPTATGLSLRLNHPMIFPRKEVKAHGTRRTVEGNFQSGETVVVVDDILITGKSVMEGSEKLKSCGLKVKDIVVFLDHEQGVKDKLSEFGYRAHSVLTLGDITQTLYEAGRIDDKQYEVLRHSEG
ncbi:bifunctional orotidine-5'-phosphate decarboxylase/orotate phosphoribosyltransferase [Lusitaniella coriacea LEGE 07157]|uniref:Orotate phosphoribosyltransferase n=1 Tax=Lusitaniella coriacea LEGE 07157 TaxID=945747 RepID=A0A8J7IR98_9CYAN|nr:bifunctional orotidine-5'-phosphate decarboxylase/orotate phosphoribosyltransferase [Lusitaniella coriacea]MBE9115622.1 bifunctional orotidine-5'-phosphate decarboxylase/orotate phosphoribosyltransferase [Lusitaniella coriacea LEGE 07157]